MSTNPHVRIFLLIIKLLTLRRSCPLFNIVAHHRKKEEEKNENKNKLVKINFFQFSYSYG